MNLDEKSRCVPCRRRFDRPKQCPSNAPPPTPPQPQKRKIMEHPSLRYVTEPMLCEYLWKEEKRLQEIPDNETYEDYVHKYCLNYIRSFFNVHLDDTWFRNLYSPYHKHVFRNLYSPYHKHVHIRQYFYQNSSIAVECRRLREWITCLSPESPQDVNALFQDTIRVTAGAFVITGLATTCPNPLILSYRDDLANPDDDPMVIALPVVCLPPQNGEPRNKGSKLKHTTLSVAISRPARFTGDLDAATRLAAALDAAEEIPDGYRLADLLAESSPLLWQQVSDRLDFSIAYLRRVHLLSFYHACLKVESLADVVTGQTPVATIYLRQDVLDEEGGPDLLVQRMDEGVASALVEYCDTSSEWHHCRQQIAAEAAAIDADMIVTEQRWCSKLTIVETADGRARCGVQGYAKLFRDVSYLYKHLIKKHAATDRPVPDVLVDCGQPGWLPSAVTGVIPSCADPSPSLPRIRPAPQIPRPRPSVNATSFVDVDDMKEEKVELSFENVVVPDVLVGKKKKKRKLL